MFVKFIAAAGVAVGVTAGIAGTASADQQAYGPYDSYSDCSAAAKQAGLDDMGCHPAQGNQTGGWYLYPSTSTGSGS